jgi:hypothetical protein
MAFEVPLLLGAGVFSAELEVGDDAVLEVELDTVVVVLVGALIENRSE